MQSRRFFKFGVNFNILVDPIYVVSPRSSYPAPVSGYIITEFGDDIITEDGNLMVTE